VFYGEYEHTNRQKGQDHNPLEIPRFPEEYDVERFRDKRLDKCLFLFTEDEWKAQESKFKSIPFTKSESRNSIDYIFPAPPRSKCDGQGRVSSEISKGFRRDKEGHNIYRCFEQDGGLV